MMSRLCVTLLRPTAVRSAVVRKFGGESAYEKLYCPKSLVNPRNGVKDSSLGVVIVVTGIAMAIAVGFPIYFVCSSLDVTLNKSRPYTWQDIKPGRRDVLLTKRTFADMHEDIKQITSLLDNPNDKMSPDKEFLKKKESS